MNKDYLYFKPLLSNCSLRSFVNNKDDDASVSVYGTVSTIDVSGAVSVFTSSLLLTRSSRPLISLFLFNISFRVRLIPWKRLHKSNGFHFIIQQIFGVMV